MATAKFEGKVAVVTGANYGGIGHEAAKSLARQGFTVCLVGRSVERGADAVQRITKATGNANVSFVLGDMASFTSVTRAANDVLAKYPSVHVLVNNAAIINTTRKVTADGIEENWQVNALAYFQFTLLLLERIIASGSSSSPSRIINVGSDGYRLVPAIHFDDLEYTTPGVYSTMGAYMHSKLANLHFSNELARRLTAKGANVTVSTIHPGPVYTRLADHNAPWVAWVKVLFIGAILRSPVDGAKGIVWAATVNPPPPTASYIAHWTFFTPRPEKVQAHGRDGEAEAKLWRVMAKQVGIDWPAMS